MENNKIFKSAKLIPILLFLVFSLILPQYANAGLSESCFPGVECDAGEDYYNDDCRSHIETLATCGTPPASKFYGFSCTNGCYLRSKPTPVICPGGVQIAGSCYTIMDVIDHNNLFKIWDGTLLSRLVVLPDADCTDTFVPAWDDSTSTWYCAEGGHWTEHANGTDIFYNKTGQQVGIGTAAPAYTLDVNGDTNITGNLRVDGNTHITGDLTVDGTTNTKDLNVTDTATIEDLTVTGTTILNDLIINGDKSGLIATFVGMTSGSYDGDQEGYKNVTELCAGQYGNSHVCTAQEMINSYNKNVVPVLTGKVAWINVAGPGNVSPAVNDCNGWSDDYSTGDYYGTAWVFDASAAGVAPCNATFSYTCCK